MSRRADGALERDILAELWSAGDPLTPADVRDRLGQGLAYTTVATVLGRLHDKGLVERTTQGRGFAYRSAVSEAELAARRITELVSTAADRGAVLSGFVHHLSRRDAATLRALLDKQTPAQRRQP